VSLHVSEVRHNLVNVFLKLVLQDLISFGVGVLGIAEVLLVQVYLEGGYLTPFLSVLVVLVQ